MEVFIIKKDIKIEDGRFSFEKYMNRHKYFEDKLRTIFQSNEYYIKDIKTSKGKENEHSRKGVYLLFHPDHKEPIYAGQAGKKGTKGHISMRMYDHYHTDSSKGLNKMIEKLGIITKEEKNKFLEKCTIKYIELESPKERDDFESFLIIYLQPILNYL